MDTNEYIAGLREFADWVEANAEVFDDVDLDCEMRMLIYANTVADLARYVTALGAAEESLSEKYYERRRQFGPIEVMAYTAKSIVLDPALRERPIVAAAEDDVEHSVRAEEIEGAAA